MSCCQPSGCEPSYPVNILAQAIRDALAERILELQGYRDDAKQSADSAHNSALASAQSAYESGMYREQTQDIFNSAQQLVPRIGQVASDLQETAETIENIARNASSYTVVNYYYTTVGGETLIVIPEDMAVLTVQAIYIEGVRQDSGYGFSYESSIRTITLAEPIPEDAVGLVLTIQLGQTNVDSPETVLSALAKLSGAGLVTTLSGQSVQSELDNLKDTNQDQSEAIEQISEDTQGLTDKFNSLADPAKGDSLIAVKQPYLGSVLRTQHDKNIEIVSVKDFGAKGDGVTDDTAAFQAMFSSGIRYGSWPSGDYKISATLSIPDGFTLYSHGAALIAANSSLTVLEANDVYDWSIKGRTRIIGTGKGNGSANGFKIINGGRFYVENVAIFNMNGNGFYQPSLGTYVSPRGDKGIFIGCMAKDCWFGRKDDPNTNSANLVNEYCTWIGFHATGNQVGNSTSAGNNSFIGGKLVDNVDGLWLVGGNNSTHGTMVGVQINHNSNYNINIDSTTAGFLFSGCTIFGDSATNGVLRIVNSRGIQIVGCLLEASVYVDGAASNVLIQGCYNNGNFTLNFAGLNPENIYKVNNMTLGGPAAWNDQGFDYVNVFKNAVVNLTANSQTKVVFDALQNYNLRKKYSLATGTYTAPNRGVYRVMGSVKVGGTVTAAYLTIKRNGADVAYAGSTMVAGFAIMPFNFDLDLNPGDTVEIFVTASGSSLTVAANPGCNMSIQGLW